MKKPILFLLILASQFVHAQIVNGIYTGTLVNDSTKKEQRFELALTDYRGKITGYSYTTFVQNDTFYYSIKRVKGTRHEGEIRIEDVKMIANNFPQGPDKGVRQITHIMATNEDTLRTVRGNWETTKTKVFYSIGGGAAMKQSNDSAASSLVRHLKELNIIASPNYASAETSKPVIAIPQREDVPVKPAEENKKQAAVNKNDRKKQVAGAEASQTAQPVAKKDITPSKIPYEKRQVRVMQEVEVRTDSLYISFYDNGVIDGDSISVYCNGVAVVQNVKLLSTATKVVIAFPTSDRAEILLVAENLGTLPPNTGLIVVRDGDQTYQLNFTADLQTNASIVLKRKK
jgi:hypothetical protein